jgi:hypothetical protein
MVCICPNEKGHIDVILSDYDGTLCSTTSIRSGVGHIYVEYCNAEGFTYVRKLYLDNSINLLYEVRL